MNEAITHQQTALKSNPRNPLYLQYLRNHQSLLAATLLRLGDHAGASKAAQALSGTRPDNWQDAHEAAGFLVKCVAQAERDKSLESANRKATVRSYVHQGRGLFQEAVRRGSGDPKAQNDLAWSLAACPDPRFRDPAQAVKLAGTAVAISPKEGNYWNTLGVAQCRSGDWENAIEALTKSMEFRSGGDAFDWLFLAMAHWQSGDKEKARTWYTQAIEEMEKDKSQEDGLKQFRAEAAALLGVTELPADVFSGP